MADIFTLNGTLADLGISADDNVLHAYVKSNLPPNAGLIDTTNKVLMLGAVKLKVNKGLGTWTVDLTDTDGTDLNVEAGTLRYELVAKFFDAGSRAERTYASGDFELTADTDFTDLDLDIPVVTPAWRSAFVDEVSGLLGDAEASAAAAAASAAAVEDLLITDLGTTDGQTKTLIELPSSQTAMALSATYAGRTIVSTPHLRVWGHSFAAGVGPGVDADTQGFAVLAAKELRLPLSNLAVGGSVLAHSDGAAGWVAVMQAETRPRTFTPYGGAFEMLHGINDINRLGNTLTHLLPYRHAVRAVVARFNCAAVFEDTDTTVALGGSGTWQFVSATTGNSGSRLAYNATSGATVTITTPADFPGGTINLGFLGWTAGGGSGTITGPVSLGSPVLNTADFAGQPYRTTGVMRIEDVPAGAASYVFTTSSVSGSVGVIFDWWGWEPSEEAAPIVAIIGQPKPLDYAAYDAGGINGPPTDTGVDNVNSIHQAIAAEFGPRTFYVDVSGIDKDGDYWSAGNVHPNVAGHAYIAEQVSLETSKASSFTVIGRPSTSSISGAAVADVQVFNAAGTWTKPTGAKSVRVAIVSGGGGGGSGRRGAAGSTRCGGGAGGGGSRVEREFPASALTSTVAVTVGAGGAGGAAVAADDTNGANGANGGVSTFGAFARSTVGTAGQGGTNAAGTNGAGGLGVEEGSNGGAASTIGGAGVTGLSARGAAGGGGGGGIGTGNLANVGGVGGYSLGSGYWNNATAGVIDGAAPGVGWSQPVDSGLSGNGGGGGASSITTAAQAGANGGRYGGGGGGGGASVNGSASGKGGDGSAGVVIVTTYF